MIYVLQNLIYCLLFILMIKIGVGNSALNGLYFYPKAVRERVYELGLTDRQTVKKKKIIFMTAFYIVMLTAILLIIGLWNGVRDFWTGYIQALVMLEVMNWFDGIVIDKIWVAKSKFWVIAGTEDIPFVQTWKQVLKKRMILSLIWIVGAAVIAGLDVMIFGGILG